MLGNEVESTLCADDALRIGTAQARAVDCGGVETYHIMSDALPQIVWSARPDGSRDYFNDRWTEHTGLSGTSSTDWGWLAALHPDDIEGCRASWLAAVQGTEAHEWEYRLHCADDDTYRWHVERALPVYGPRGELVKWFGSCTDIDALKTIQAEVERLNGQLRRAMTETHHRVKNNLQIISAMIDLQLMNGEPTISSEEFRRLSSHVRTLASVHDILTEGAKEGATQQAISLAEVFGKLLPVHEQVAPHCRITARIEDIALSGRQGTSLALVINELISNATKHGKGAVEVIVATHGPLTAVTVCDDGPGFPMGFDPVTAANTGIELILSLVQWDLGGRVEFANQERGGAQVTITFPTADDSRLRGAGSA